MGPLEGKMQEGTVGVGDDQQQHQHSMDLTGSIQVCQGVQLSV